MVSIRSLTGPSSRVIVTHPEGLAECGHRRTRRAEERPSRPARPDRASRASVVPPRPGTAVGAPERSPRTPAATAPRTTPVPGPRSRWRCMPPPPLDVPMTVTPCRGAAVSSRRTTGGRCCPPAAAIDAVADVEPVDAGEARAAAASYAGLRSHPFPTCFSCGTGREPGDGLRIFPGRVADATAEDGDPPRTRSPRPGRPTRPWPRTSTPTPTSTRARASRSPGRRSTASAAGPATSRNG